MKKLFLLFIFCAVAFTTYSQTYPVTIAQNPAMQNITGYAVHMHVTVLNSSGNLQYYCWGSQQIPFWFVQRTYPPIIFTKYIGDPAYPIGTLVSYTFMITNGLGDIHTFTFNVGSGVRQLKTKSNGTKTLMSGAATPVSTFYLNTIN